MRLLFVVILGLTFESCKVRQAPSDDQNDASVKAGPTSGLLNCNSASTKKPFMTAKIVGDGVLNDFKFLDLEYMKRMTKGADYLDHGDDQWRPFVNSPVKVIGEVIKKNGTYLYDEAAKYVFVGNKVYRFKGKDESSYEQGQLILPINLNPPAILLKEFRSLPINVASFSNIRTYVPTYNALIITNQDINLDGTTYKNIYFLTCSKN